MKKKLLLLITAFILVISFQTQAHYIWIELGSPAKIGQEQEIHIYYGEFNEGVREIKGGRLEELQGIVAWVIAPDGKQTPLTLTTESKFFRTSFTPGQQGKYVVVAVNTVRDVVDWSMHDIGIVRPVYYASREISVGNSQQVSEIFPPEAVILITSTPREKNAFQITFKGKPLASAKVFFHAPNEWSKQLTTDKNGVVKFNPLWKGQYIIECIYPEKTPGNFKGKEYEAIRHRSTLVLNIQ